RGPAPAGPPHVKMMSFTGSTKAGSVVAQTAAGHIAPALLELGGKNAFLVFDDADVDRAVRDALEGGFYNKGEACTAASRVVVQKGIAEAFTTQLGAGVRKLKVGAGNDPSTHVGPAVSKAQQPTAASSRQESSSRATSSGRCATSANGRTHAT